MAICKILKKNILHNYELMTEVCQKNDAILNVVSKFNLSNPKIIDFLYEAAKNRDSFTISDSNMENFCHLGKELAGKITKTVIKTRLSDIKKIPELEPEYRPDRLFISDEALLQAVEDLPESMRPQIVLITETGDLKDGLLPADISRISKEWPKINIIGISVNFSCLSGILPDMETVRMLAELAREVQINRGLKKPFLSVGGTVIYALAQTGALKGLIQEIRSGEGIFFGYDSSGGRALPGFKNDTFRLEGEILEVSVKDFALREGHAAGFTATGVDAEGGHGSCGSAEINRGCRKRAVLDFGVLGASQADLIPVDKKAIPAGQTFDFTVVDITDSNETYGVGDKIGFTTNYASASFIMMNRYIPCFVVED